MRPPDGVLLFCVMVAVRIWNIVIVSRTLNGLVEMADFSASVCRPVFNPNLSWNLVSGEVRL